jgi:hypothetical protein
MAKSGRQLLVTFWVVFLVAGSCAAVTSPQSSVVGSLAQLMLGLFWFGYPVALFRCLSDDKRRSGGAILLVGAIALGYWLSVFASSESGGTIRGVVAPVAGAVLVFLPFVAGALALRNAEDRVQLKSEASVVLTALALFAFPFFGGYVHDRLRRVHTALKLGDGGRASE